MGFRFVFLAVGTIIALQFSEIVFLECERDWLANQSNERIPKKRWKFTYERSPVLTHRYRLISLIIRLLVNKLTDSLMLNAIANTLPDSL